MLKIKLIRFGQKNQPHYRIVAQEAKAKRDGKYTTLVGHYTPALKTKILTINLEKYQDLLNNGAQPTKTVASLVTKFKSGKPFKPKIKKKSKKKNTAENEKKVVNKQKTQKNEKPA